MTSSISLAQVGGLSAYGWILMLSCIGLVCALCLYCFVHILREPKASEHLHAPLDIDTKDQD